MKKFYGILAALILTSCGQDKNNLPTETLDTSMKTSGKVVVYQVFTRLFGNTKTTNTPWGTLEENGVGKFADFTPLALREIQESWGNTHLVYRGTASCTCNRLYGFRYLQRRPGCHQRQGRLALCGKRLLQCESGSCRRTRGIALRNSVSWWSGRTRPE